MKKEKKQFDPDAFRDSLSGMNDDGSRKWVYAVQPKGIYYTIRTYISWVYLAIFFAMPFISINGVPFLQFNVVDLRFILFGKIFTPDDFFIFAVGMIAFIVFIVLFTIIYGRIFCGWICPQTIFMEMVFRKIEYLIEGGANAQRALNRSPWNANKILRRGGKHIVFFLLSFLIANTFLAYIVGVKTLFKYIPEPFEHMSLIFGLFIFTLLFYSVYAFLRELACTVICPYGRLQSVLIDKDTIVVAYDHVRGEPRGFKKNVSQEESGLGDCVDCNQCVVVCPMGIDIRNGTQMECTNCTACIDACDDVMDKVGRPRGLIRYASENNIEQGKKFVFTGRMKAYTGVLVLLIAFMAFLLITRSNLDAHITRSPGQLYAEMENNKLANFYQIKLVNKTNGEFPISLKLENIKGELKMLGAESTVLINPLEHEKANFIILIDKSQIKSRKTNLKIGVYSNGQKINTIKTAFLGPFM
ncbi:MAG: cytochrome c oxidase accessory protein CcoG [Chitinophagales bacterium]